ncbi:hypothetical protein JRI60_08010 [Archangium violaceum]|uniref:hypothetical protein n=1 Tax=Archangium violaceum TaxID=83451 RepID=UPI00194F94FF|nr:hypothetical protein [Archangium violaceum]QRN98962.1 hypothetical protein JRI60_08010 [Archangium violaceum]
MFKRNDKMQNLIRRPDGSVLLEVRAAFDEATKLRDADRYSESLARAEHALSLPRRGRQRASSY